MRGADEEGAAVFVWSEHPTTQCTVVLEGDSAEPSRPGLPEGLFRLVLMFLY